MNVNITILIVFITCVILLLNYISRVAFMFSRFFLVVLNKHLILFISQPLFHRNSLREYYMQWNVPWTPQYFFSRDEALWRHKTRLIAEEELPPLVVNKL